MDDENDFRPSTAPSRGRKKNADSANVLFDSSINDEIGEDFFSAVKKNKNNKATDKTQKSETEKKGVIPAGKFIKSHLWRSVILLKAARKLHHVHQILLLHYGYFAFLSVGSTGFCFSFYYSGMTFP